MTRAVLLRMSISMIGDAKYDSRPLHDGTRGKDELLHSRLMLEEYIFDHFIITCSMCPSSRLGADPLYHGSSAA